MTPSEVKYFQEVARNIANAKHGTVGPYIKSIMEKLGMSRNRIYKNLKEVGYESGRKTRSDRGDTHIDLNDARLICNMMHSTRRRNDKRLLSCEHAIEIAYANQKIKEQYNASTLLRVAKEHGFHPDQLAAPTPHITMQSLHPNHVWQVDASVGVLFYLPAGGVQFFDETKHYKNKPENLDKVRNHLCIRYAAIDHYSGAFYCKYYAASGENQEIFFDVLANAFSKRKRDPFHGVPHMLVMDKGAANTSHLVTSFLDKLNIQHYAHKAGNPRAKGSGEKIQDIIERQFEGGLRFLETQVKDVHELNELAEQWRIYFNDTAIHTRTQKTRTAVWQTIREDQLILAPSMETMQAILTSKPEERTVRGDLTITYKGRGFEGYKTYSVEHIPSVKVQDKVIVSLNPYRAPNIDIEITDYKGDVTYYECTPIEMTDAGFYADAPIFGEAMGSVRDTVADKERKAMSKIAYNVETLEEVEKLQKKGVQLFDGSLDPMKHVHEHLDAMANVEAMPKRGTVLEIEAPHQVLESISVAEACKRLRAEMGERYPSDAYQQLSKRYPEGIDPMKLDSIKSQLITRATLKVAGE